MKKMLVQGSPKRFMLLVALLLVALLLVVSVGIFGCWASTPSPEKV